MEKLFEAAMDAAKRAYCPYSNFRVGAAILLEDGSIITGVNVENRSFGATNCAERTAIFTAVAQGYKSFKAIAIATPDADYPVGPCGICRQVLSEFAPGNTPVLFGCSTTKQISTTLEGVYPFDSLHELASAK